MAWPPRPIAWTSLTGTICVRPKLRGQQLVSAAGHGEAVEIGQVDAAGGQDGTHGLLVRVAVIGLVPVAQFPVDAGHHVRVGNAEVDRCL